MFEIDVLDQLVNIIVSPLRVLPAEVIADQSEEVTVRFVVRLGSLDKLYELVNSFILVVVRRVVVVDNCGRLLLPVVVRKRFVARVVVVEYVGEDLCIVRRLPEELKLLLFLAPILLDVVNTSEEISLHADLSEQMRICQ